MNKMQHLKLFANDVRTNVAKRTAAPTRERTTDAGDDEPPAKVFPAGF